MEQYFTPDIEDIRVGYECEWYNPLRNEWYKDVISEPIESQDTKIDEHIPIQRDIENKRIRVPYLTEVQIESEGWKKEGDKYTKPIDDITDWVLEYFEPNHRAYIYMRHTNKNWGDYFLGHCPSINEFRYIIKLLNIQ